ncbi:unnamed protein product [Ilex paraguariensis]|uniref:Uncharacterized protein n=1 Tax=Ilex paraguariensis TaxID=185542 RepID=A0ABC8S631_9AQUA
MANCSTNVKEEISADPVPIKDDAVGNLSGSSKAYPTEVKEGKSDDPVPIKDDAAGKPNSTEVKEEK